MPEDNSPSSSLSEAELTAYLHWYWPTDGERLAPQMVDLLRAYALRRLRAWLSHQELSGLSQEAARLLCRAYIRRAVAEFTAWTPLATRTAA